MSRLSPGDRILVNIRENRIVSMYDTIVEDKKVLDIAGVYDEGYWGFVPSAFFLKDTVYINKSNYKGFKLDKRFIDSEVIYINDYKIAAIVSRIDGMRCINCDDFCQYAESNREDGSFICYSCKSSPWRKIKLT